MAKIITESGRKAIKKMAQISQCSRALTLMPTAEHFGMRLIGDLRSISKSVNDISTRINDILDRYSNIPSEFLLESFDVLLDKLDNISDYAKFAIEETTSVMSNTVKSSQEIVEAVGNATSGITSATLQIGAGMTYGSIAMYSNIKLAMSGNGRRSITYDVVQDVVNGKVPVAEMKEEIEGRINEKVGDEEALVDSIRDWTKNKTDNWTKSIDGVFEKGVNGIDNAFDWIDGVKENGDKIVDDTVGVLIEKVENEKKTVEEQIERVRNIFNNFTKNFDEYFGFINGKNLAEESFRNISNTAYEKMDGPVFDAIGETTDAVADFINNFNIGKVVTAIGNLVIGAGSATLAMDLLPNIDVDRMLRNVIGGIDTEKVDILSKLYNGKNFDSIPDLLDIPDIPWQLNKDDLERYTSNGYEKYLEDFSEENIKIKSRMYEQMWKSTAWSNISDVTKADIEKMNENKSALKAMQKVRRDAIKAKQIEKYKHFLSMELEYLKRDCMNIKVNIKNEWDLMMMQYKTAIKEITNFFTKEGCGGNEIIDRCCDIINDDATQIVELCKSITIELTSAVSMVPTPYAIGTCVDMPVHKILAFFKDIKIIITFIKDLIRLGIDIISQLTILAKIIFNGFQSLSEIMQMLKDILGIDAILNMIDFLIALFRPKMIDAKMLLENSLSPIYYNETDDYEARVEALEALLEDDKSGGNVEIFKYTDDKYAKDKYRNMQFGGKLKDDDAIEDALEELEAKGEREIVAYRSPILNAAGDDFAGWIFYHPDAYDDMKDTWRDRKKRRRNKLIKKASKKNKIIMGKLMGGVAQLKKNMRFGYYKDGKYIGNSVTGFDAYYWYTKWTNDPTDCEPDYSVKDGENIVSPIQTTANGSLVELSDGRRVFVEGKNVKSGDFVNVDGVKYRVK